MAVDAAALETYDSITIREDLADAENMISPTETPFTTMIAGRNKATSTKHEWPTTALNAVDESNAVAEGEDSPAVDAAVLAKRRWNFTQIMDKVVKVTDTSQRVDGAASIEKLARQISYKLRELKRDKEAIFTSGQAADEGAAVGATVRKSAGFAAFPITNYTGGAGGSAPTLSDSPGGNGYPNAGPGAGTKTAITEDQLNASMQACWTEGGEPKYALVSPVNKRLISKTFTGYATKYKQADDKKIVNSIDVYESDFGQLQIVPDRFLGTVAGTKGHVVFLIDPDYVKISELQTTRQLPLARTGHTENRLIQCESCVEVGNEAAHATICDTTG